MLNKENVKEVLKDVIYFPKGDNIIALNMVENLMVNEEGVRFDLIVDHQDDPKNEILVNAANRTLKGVFGEINVDIKVKSAEAALAKVRHIVAVVSENRLWRPTWLSPWPAPTNVLASSTPTSTALRCQ